MNSEPSYDSYLTSIKPSYNPETSYGHAPVTHTQQPIVTGTSVIGIKYKDGVMLAADCLASYGSLARYKDVQRLHKVNKTTLLGASGDISDYQAVQHILKKISVEDAIQDDGHSLNSKNIFEYMCNLMYSRRTKMNPLWNHFVIAGVVKGEGFLGAVDLKGNHHQAPTIATGFGAYLAQPILREAYENSNGQLSEDEAKQVLEKSMKVLYYRDARSINKIQLSKVTEEGVTISEPYSLETEWAFAENIRGYGA
ncbi:proteasome endopeptidase complex, beta subunit [Neoconidiobolus thromboides FSU 785]|nr:proteasome endopeptidase complex, beta subunit [Neoconidiobolus thromboides FSU 785]